MKQETLLNRKENDKMQEAHSVEPTLDIGDKRVVKPNVELRLGHFFTFLKY